MKILFSLILISCFSMITVAQVDIEYQVPDSSILELADAPLPPRVRINSEGDQIVLLKRHNYKSIEELSEEEMRLAGLRINPVTNSSSRSRYYYSISLMRVGTKDELEVNGLPPSGRYSNFSWSPDESMIAFTNTTRKGVELWVLNIEKSIAWKLTGDSLNANLGRPFEWFKDNMALLVKFIPVDRKELINKKSVVPTGPTVSVNDGKKAQNRTYQDLLKDKNDEFNFEQLALATLYRVSIDGQANQWKETDLYSNMDFSPDGEFVTVSTIGKPFSYLVPYYRFPSTTIIYDKYGNEVNRFLEVPLTEDLPKGFMAVRKGKRNLSWRADKPSTLVWVEALDEGDPEKEVEHRDIVYQLDAPFTSEPVEVMKTVNRYSGIIWGNDQHAIAMDYWWNTRMIRTTLIDPSQPGGAPVLISERNYQDRYNDPGNFVTRLSKYSTRVLEIDKHHLYLMGDGYSEDGIWPFVDKLNLETLEKERIWQAEKNDKLERLSYAINIKKGKILSTIQSRSMYPNSFIRNINKGTLEQITFIENPFSSIEHIQKKLIQYQRDDGVELSAVLYLPADYDTLNKEKLPMLMWAYPREFKDRSSAGQVTTSPNEFTYPWYGSPIFWINRGYVILDDAAFPIIGEGDKEPNDTFIPQLVANAKAAIDAVDDMGYIDREKVAVGGHSYGAFMTANLLSHSDLFAAGIARSGAYNRTLTPFGFQSEERNYWEAPDIYYEMSPFMHADKMKTPLLLIHGVADNNSGTYPMQSERYFNALKGLGATVRLVMLPKESHGYFGRDCILLILLVQDLGREYFV
ncbi:MAG: prolyl oligopeptidase family serine peptidase [bacterium]